MGVDHPETQRALYTTTHPVFTIRPVFAPVLDPTGPKAFIECRVPGADPGFLAPAPTGGRFFFVFLL